MDAGSGDVAPAEAGSSGVEVTGEKSRESRTDSNVVDDDDDVDGGTVRPHHFDKNIYTFSAAAGRSLQKQTDDIKNLVYVHVTQCFSCVCYSFPSSDLLWSLCCMSM